MARLTRDPHLFQMLHQHAPEGFLSTVPCPKRTNYKVVISVRVYADE